MDTGERINTRPIPFPQDEHGTQFEITSVKSNPEYLKP